MRKGCFELYGLWTLFSVLCARLTLGDFNYHAIRKKLRHNCDIQGARLIWKQKIWLAICELLCSLTNQNACFITFLHSISSFLRKNCTVLSQSESSNFFMYIINQEMYGYPDAVVGQLLDENHFYIQTRGASSASRFTIFSKNTVSTKCEVI